MSPSNVVEIGDITAGIVVQEKPGREKPGQERPGRWRFYASDARFRRLEPRTFASAGQATRAARELVAPARALAGPLT